MSSEVKLNSKAKNIKTKIVESSIQFHSSSNDISRDMCDSNIQPYEYASRSVHLFNKCCSPNITTKPQSLKQEVESCQG